MSYRVVSALGPAKEIFHLFGQFLDSAQCAECQPLHFLLGLGAIQGNALISDPEMVDDLVGAAVFLSPDAAVFITEIALPVDGSYTRVESQHV